MSNFQFSNLPEGWICGRLGDFAKAKGGKRLPKGNALTTTPNSHPYVRVCDFRDGRVDKANLLYVPDDVFPAISRYIISTKDIYISIVGTVGLVGVIDDDLEGANLTENAAKICEINSRKVEQGFLLSYLRSNWGQSEIKSQTVGSTQPKLGLFRIENIRVPLPPLPEQKSIAQVLAGFDDKIELNRRMNATLEAMAQTLFRAWFVDFEPVKAKAAGIAPVGLDDETAALFPDSFAASTCGPIPQGWEVKQLHESFEINPTRQLGKGSDATYLDMASVQTQGHRPAGWIQRNLVRE